MPTMPGCEELRPVNPFQLLLAGGHRFQYLREEWMAEKFTPFDFPLSGAEMAE